MTLSSSPSPSPSPSPIPAAVLARWPAFANASVRPFGTGLINKTFLAEATSTSGGEPQRAIFQRLHPVFAGSVNEDIDAVTRHLEKKGLVTTRIVPTGDGALFVDDPVDARPWRALTFVNGTSVDRIDAPARAFAGAALVAKFHRAVADLSHQYKHVRAGVHDTGKHLANLARALDEHPAHRLFVDVEPIASAILAAGRALPDFTKLPQRHSHGDLKISNVLFDASTGSGICLVDLDTLGLLPWPHEMGDALRSWTNPLGEDVESASVNVDIFRATIQGYASTGRGFVTPEERDTLVDGLLTICLELSSRFLADALQESYFGWNEAKFKTRGEHNLLRARGQWSLAQSVRAQKAELEAIVRAEL